MLWEWDDEIVQAAFHEATNRYRQSLIELSLARGAMIEAMRHECDRRLTKLGINTGDTVAIMYSDGPWLAIFEGLTNFQHMISLRFISKRGKPNKTVEHENISILDHMTKAGPAVNQ
jgi:hypothetical protein